MNTLGIITHIDQTLTSLLFSLPSSTLLITIMRFFSFEGIFALIWVIAALYVYKTRIANHHKPHLLIEILILLLALNTLLNVVIKPLIARPRPFSNPTLSYQPPNPLLTRLLAVPTLDAHRPLKTTAYPQDFSFPSGHATLAFAFATLMARRDKKRMGIYFIFAALVAFSRIYLGYHYVLDVIGGAIIGWVTAKLFIKIFKITSPS